VDAGAHVTALIRDWDPQSELIRGGVVARATVVSGCVEDYPTIERALLAQEIDTVFHLAAQTIVGAAYGSPLATFEINVRGTYNLLEACRRHPDNIERIVVASSDKAYGASQELPYVETMAPLGRFPYDVSRSCADLIAQSYFHTYGTPVAIARCGNIYGGGDLNWSRVIPGTIRSLHFGRRPGVRSDGSYTRDYVYVADAAGAYLRMAEKLDSTAVRGEAFNFGPAEPRSVAEVIGELRRLMGREDLEPEVLNGARAEIRHQYLSSEKARTVLAWKPRYTLVEGLSRSIDWYREFFGRAA
jgi:CDP-glucose 4,6-dehydratase